MPRSRSCGAVRDNARACGGAVTTDRGPIAAVDAAAGARRGGGPGRGVGGGRDCGGLVAAGGEPGGHEPAVDRRSSVLGPDADRLERGDRRREDACRCDPRHGRADAGPTRAGQATPGHRDRDDRSRRRRDGRSRRCGERVLRQRRGRVGRHDGGGCHERRAGEARCILRLRGPRHWQDRAQSDRSRWAMARSRWFRLLARQVEDRSVDDACSAVANTLVSKRRSCSGTLHREASACRSHWGSRRARG